MIRWVLLVLAGLCMPATADAAWHSAESDNFIVIGNMSAGQIRSRALDLERFHHLLVESTGSNDEAPFIKLRVFVVRNFDTVQEFGGVSDALGYYDAPMRGPHLVVPRLTPRSAILSITPRQILFHEYAHHFMFANFPGTYPAWYVEGFAEFYANVDFSEENEAIIGFAPTIRRDLLVLGIWESYQDILANNRGNTAMTYAQAWALVHYAYFNREGSQLMRSYLDTIVSGQEGQAAYAQTFGTMEPPLDSTMRDYALQSRIPGRRIPLPDINPESITVTSMSQEAGEIAILVGRNPAQLHDRVERLAERYPDNPQIHTELAISYRQRGEFEQELASANRALAIDPDHIGGLVMKAEALKDLADAAGDANDPRWSESRELFLQVNRRDPTNAQALHGYYDSFPEGADRPDFALQALESARALVPQNAHFRTDLAEEYLALGRLSEALAELMPILQSPHFAENARAASIEQQIRQAVVQQAGAQ